MTYYPTKKSIKQHQVPEWFHDAKLGIFIHWGLYSVPAWARTGIDLVELTKEEGMEGNFRNNPYAEWYLNSLRIAGTPTQEYHREHYGEDFEYDDFVPMFNEAIQKWSPDEMADLFKRAGAQYVVLVTKHHDGFLLWPSDHPHPQKEHYHASRDIVGELSEAVRMKGMKMGHYYSGTLDWSFNPEPITDIATMINNGVMTQEYINYANGHWRELIDKYKTKILWNDIGYPPRVDLYKLFAYFYNTIPEGIINDRWSQFSKFIRKVIKFKPIKAIVHYFVKRAMAKEGAGGGPSLFTPHYDFITPEYAHFKEIKEVKWESTRGIGNSFGYNRAETAEDYLEPAELIRMFVDIVSKNGNLLLNVGPKADGTIPKEQKAVLLALGDWLEINGEGIFGTRPWKRAEGRTKEGIEVRFTQKKSADTLYVFLLSQPETQTVLIENLRVKKESTIQVLGAEESLRFTQTASDLQVELPALPEQGPVWPLKITPLPS